MNLTIGFGRAVREARERKGLTLRQFAAKLGLSAPFVSDLEHGRRGTERLDDIARVLEVDKHDLLAKSERYQREELAWLEARPDLMAILRRWRRRDDYPGPPLPNAHRRRPR